MPVAKSLANAQESFYMANGSYSEDLGTLDIRLPGNISGLTANFGDGITATISDEEGYSYVKMSKDDLENNYIIYQNRSENYPGEIHCEAFKDSARAKRVCESMGGRVISGSLTDGYDTYVLEGTGRFVSVP